MTEAQRTYLADLSIKKGVKITDAIDMPVAMASKRIEDLKAMPDAKLDELTPEMVKKVDTLTDKAVRELHKWSFNQ